MKTMICSEQQFIKLSELNNFVPNIHTSNFKLPAHDSRKECDVSSGEQTSICGRDGESSNTLISSSKLLMSRLCYSKTLKKIRIFFQKNFRNLTTHPPQTFCLKRKVALFQSFSFFIVTFD